MRDLTGGELVRLEIPAQPAFVGVARSVVTAVASAVDSIDDDRLEDLRVAVSEACTNAVEAHRRDAVDDRIVVRCVSTSDSFSVSIEDRRADVSLAAAADEVPAAPGPDAPPNASEHSWGIQLIQALVDQARFRETQEGTAVDLVFRFERGAD